MRTLHCIGLCLLLACKVISQEWDDFFKSTSERKIASWREEFKSPEALRNALKKKLTLSVSLHPHYNLFDFKEKFDVKDEDIRTALMGIYRESAHKLESVRREENPNFISDVSECSGAISWMGAFADEPMKRFLLKLAMDSTVAPAPRDAAIGAYLRCADALETKDFFVYFLGEKERFTDAVKSAIFKHVPYKDVDKHKREAALASLYVATAQAEDWKQFERLDWFLITRGAKDYLASHQRAALLKKHSASEPVEARGGDVPTLKERLDFIPSTNISTNLTELMVRDFLPAPFLPSDWKKFEAFSEDETIRLRRVFKDEENLRKGFKILLRQVTSQNDAPTRFKRKFEVSSEIMQTALMNIYKEYEWVPEGLDTEEAREAIRWLGFCADMQITTQVLPFIFGDAHYGVKARITAFEAYLRRADTQTLKDSLVWFLTNDLKIDTLVMYNVVIKIHDEIEGDTQKREVILAAMSAALVKEEDKKAFEEADKLLAERSKEYAESPRRKTALERMNKPPEKETP